MSRRPQNWGDKLGISGTNLNTKEAAQAAHKALTGENGAIPKVEKEIKNLNQKQGNQQAATLIDPSQQGGKAIDAHGSSEYLLFLQSCMKSDNTVATLGSSYGETVSVMSGQSGTVLDTAG